MNKATGIQKTTVGGGWKGMRKVKEEGNEGVSMIKITYVHLWKWNNEIH
jgi:hypothetical protein